MDEFSKLIAEQLEAADADAGTETDGEDIGSVDTPVHQEPLAPPSPPPLAAAPVVAAEPPPPPPAPQKAAAAAKKNGPDVAALDFFLNNKKNFEPPPKGDKKKRKKNVGYGWPRISISSVDEPDDDEEAAIFRKKKSYLTTLERIHAGFPEMADDIIDPNEASELSLSALANAVDDVEKRITSKDGNVGAGASAIPLALLIIGQMVEPRIPCMRGLTMDWLQVCEANKNTIRLVEAKWSASLSIPVEASLLFAIGSTVWNVYQKNTQTPSI